MKRINKQLLTIGVVILICMIQPVIGHAQVVDPGCDPLDPACPIDGGLSLLIAAGIEKKKKKAYNKRKKPVGL